mmetsp:Transcript_21740/g.42355  ORF Transcript_21740/g.42355 Transcript_21740/m.42355 type:complete len:214 (+) Transcript_21740:618-1259(+)
MYATWHPDRLHLEQEEARELGTDAAHAHAQSLWHVDARVAGYDGLIQRVGDEGDDELVGRGAELAVVLWCVRKGMFRHPWVRDAVEEARLAPRAGGTVGEADEELVARKGDAQGEPFAYAVQVVERGFWRRVREERRQRERTHAAGRLTRQLSPRRNARCIKRPKFETIPALAQVRSRQACENGAVCCGWRRWRRWSQWRRRRRWWRRRRYRG